MAAAFAEDKLAFPTAKLLVVDDEEAARESARMILQSHYAITLAENAERAQTNQSRFQPVQRAANA